MPLSPRSRPRERPVKLPAARRRGSRGLGTARRLSIQSPNLPLPPLALPVATHEEHHRPHEEGAAESAAEQEEHVIILRAIVVMNQYLTAVVKPRTGRLAEGRRGRQHGGESCQEHGPSLSEL